MATASIWTVLFHRSSRHWRKDDKLLKSIKHVVVGSGKESVVVIYFYVIMNLSYLVRTGALCSILL